MIPTHVARHIAATTGTDPNRSGARDRATARRCPDCQAWTLVGLDNDVMALTARVDPTPLDSATEIAALLTDRITYQLFPLPDRLLIRRRDAQLINGAPPAPDRIVVPSHVCGLPLAPAVPLHDRRQEITRAPAPF